MSSAPDVSEDDSAGQQRRHAPDSSHDYCHCYSHDDTGNGDDDGDGDTEGIGGTLMMLMLLMNGIDSNDNEWH